MKYINRKCINELVSNTEVVKAIALAIYVKQNTKSSTMKMCTINRLHELTHLHADTLRKRISVLRAKGLIEELENKSTIFKSLASSSSKFNIKFDFSIFKTVQDIEYALYAMIFIEKLRHREYIQKTLEEIKSVKKMTNKKDAEKFKKKLKNFIKLFYKYRPRTNKPITDEEFVENGISYDTIAKSLGVSRGKSIKIIEFAERHGLISITKRIKSIYIEGIGFAAKFLDKTNYTYYTNNRAYKVMANIYSINKTAI